MNQCDGQMSLFDVEENIQQNEAPVILMPGMTVYVVNKGDVLEEEVLNESWICNEGKERGYRLKIKNGIYDCAWNSSLRKSVFLVQNDALATAEEYLNTHEVIRAEEMKVVRTVAYQYSREIDNRKMIAFYSELENGMLYVREFVTFHHIVGADKKEKAIKRFMNQQEFKYNKIKQIDYKPVFKNMYRIRQKYDWDYAEAGHSYAIG